MSIYLIAEERGLVAHHPLSGRLVRWLEGLACRLPDRLILDTAEYVAWFGETYGLAADRFRLVPTGADDRVFRPIEVDRQDDSLFWALYYGTFTRNHGVEHIVEAARLLKDEPDIHFELVGDGPTKAQAMESVQKYGLTNVTFGGWVDQHTLLRKAAGADVCLGAFGTTSQSLMTVHNKIYEGLAMARPVLSGDSPTVRQSLTHGQHVYLCERANPRALADAIRTLKMDADLRRRLAESGHQLFQEQYSLEHNGVRFAAHLRELLAADGQARWEPK
jgi:glycosyltransferase involved in cell wall biosynthesis